MHALPAANGREKMKTIRKFLFFFFILFPLISYAEMDLILAKYYKENIDVSKYLVSEKLDGIRAFWDGEFLYTRNGNKINAPQWFVADLPKIKLDGELWMGRGKFNEISSLIRRKFSKEMNEEWKKVSYHLFELPEHKGDFKTRYEELLKIKKKLSSPWIFIIPQFYLKDKKELNAQLQEIVNLGGEGLMLHKADAPYVVGRSDYLLKLKPWKTTTAKVIGYVPGRGKLIGMVGALKVQTADGVEFFVGSGLSNAQRYRPPAIGRIIRVRYRDTTHQQKPRFPVYVGELGEKE